MAALPEPGDLVTEADQLLSVLADKLTGWRTQQPDRRAADVEPPGDTESDGQDGTPEAGSPARTQAAAAPCTSCPWCRLQATWHQQRPEVTAALLEAASLAVTALQTVLHSPPAGPENAGPDHHRAGHWHPAPSASGDAVRSGPEPDHASTDPEENTPVPAAADGITLQRIPIR